MGKSIRVTLEKNQFVATEVQYTVALQLQLPKPDHTMDQTIIMETVRATSVHEATGMAMYKARQNEKFSRWLIANYTVLKTGE